MAGSPAYGASCSGGRGRCTGRRLGGLFPGCAEILRGPEKPPPARSRIRHLGPPPFYVRVIAAVSQLIEVNLFLMNPCREYWGDILSGREVNALPIGRKRRKPWPGISTWRQETACWLPWALWDGISGPGS